MSDDGQVNLKARTGFLTRFVDRAKLAWAMSHAKVHPAPILSLGNQKSGTTAVAALLARCANVSVTLDIFYRFKGKPLLPLLRGELPLESFIEKHKYYFSTAIIKEPSLTFFYDQLRACFPNARFMTVIRDPRDNIRSILNRLRIPGHLDRLAPEHLAPLAKKTDWQLILDGTLYGHAGENYIDSLALRWCKAAEVYLRHRDDIVLVRYEEFVADKVGTIERLARTMGLAPCVDISGEVETQFVHRGNRSVSWCEFFGEANLERIERLCAKTMAQLNYALHPVKTDTGMEASPS